MVSSWSNKHNLLIPGGEKLVKQRKHVMIDYIQINLNDLLWVIHRGLKYGKLFFGPSLSLKKNNCKLIHQPGSNDTSLDTNPDNPGI